MLVRTKDKPYQWKDPEKRDIFYTVLVIGTAFYFIGAVMGFVSFSAFMMGLFATAYASLLFALFCGFAFILMFQRSSTVRIEDRISKLSR